LAVFIERVKHLAEQMIIFAKCEVAEMLQKQLVKHRLQDEIQHDERLASVVNNQQFLNDFPQRLPVGAMLPDILAILGEPSMSGL